VATLTPFVDPLVIPPVARPVGTRPGPQGPIPYYRLPLRVVESRVHRDVPPTRFWSFGESAPGPTIEAETGQPVWIDWVNQLPAKHFLPIDHTVHGAEAGLSESRAVVHVHGARVRPDHDGHPEHWTTPGQTASFLYPNDQDAATLWYHDHTMGINRLNVYAGLFGAYVIRDPADRALGLPAGVHDLPLLFADRTFDVAGQLIYPDSGNPAAPWVPEVFGDALLVNGRLFPYATVEPRAYRLRIVNACNARYLHLTVAEGAPVYQIGGDQGLLDRPVRATRLDLLPAERAEVVVDFSPFAGRRLHLLQDARAIIEWRVGPGPTTPFVPPAALRPVRRLLASAAESTRTHTLAEDADMYKRPMRMLLNNTRWHAPVTETPHLGSTEIWNLVNTTDDAHPIHLHLVRFQILDRRPFDVFEHLNGRGLHYAGPPVAPEPGEAGWKDTVRAEPGMVTRIIIHFEGYAGRYMWHCHLLEHGDNEMMRPMEILPAPVDKF
jgi:spore coat protein A